jgi:flagellar biosynthesis chaperone FliJ
MIDEHFYQASINIRKTYLKLTGDMDEYRKIVEQSMKSLQRSIVDIERVQKDLKDIRKSKYEVENNINTIEKVTEILNSIEMEGNRLESFINPINKEIEKLAEEEQILYKKICERHSNLTEAQIVEAVRLRLKKENLL